MTELQKVVSAVGHMRYSDPGHKQTSFGVNWMES